MTTTATLQIIDGGNKRDRRSSEKATTRPHCKVSIDDVNWIRQQPPCVQQLWLDCVAAEQYGGAAHKLDTNLSRNSFLKASAVINGAGLFEFEEVRSKTQSGRSGVTSYRVKNLHGYFNRHYWENFDNQSVTAESQAVIPENQQVMPQNHQMMPERQNLTFSEAKKPTQQEFQKPNNVSNYPLTTYQQPTKVVGMVVGSDTQAKNSREEETADAPLRGASPQRIESASELEELPTAMDCTSLTLVDAVPSQPAPLLAENQDCGVEPRDCHKGTCSAAPVAQNEFSDKEAIAHQKIEPSRPSASLLAENLVSGDEDKVDHEGTCSAAPVAQNEKSLNSAIADQPQGQEEAGNLASLMAENSVSGEEVKAVDEGESSAPSVPNPEKWSHEAIVARSNLRPERMQKLKAAANSGQNPGFDFLQECWNDDPALQIVIKKLLVKYPQWGIVIVDGALIKWNE
ncbi:hypothetical protein [Nostoc sp. C110]|uniref:hypothetical protein n=1 Tax=Nostoc sp. C110 TaxID=3349876 RepID=UPI00370D8D5F